ncbi:hypothetical protein LCGC14_0825950 [marine sediment metagenome]|uniref:Uncharacterized protein n=1 Tax=marine sediment metagenome TaxID=412755 RepID=A0A0F9S274_9ZZZZ
MDDVNVQSILTEILDEERAVRRTQKRGHRRLDLVEPHTLAKTDDHPHHLVISSVKSHRKSGSPVITRFKARCKICDEEDAWGTQEMGEFGL